MENTRTTVTVYDSTRNNGQMAARDALEKITPWRHYHSKYEGDNRYTKTARINLAAAAYINCLKSKCSTEETALKASQGETRALKSDIRKITEEIEHAKDILNKQATENAKLQQSLERLENENRQQCLARRLHSSLARLKASVARWIEMRKRRIARVNKQASLPLSQLLSTCGKVDFTPELRGRQLRRKRGKCGMSGE
jgi:septal ring factor EnvC (AmiA/AmiB activator)